MLAQHAEKLLFEAYRTTSYDFVFVEPLWLTWTMEHFSELSLPFNPHTLKRIAFCVLADFRFSPRLAPGLPLPAASHSPSASASAKCSFKDNQLTSVNSIPPLIHQHTLHLHTLSTLSRTIVDPHSTFAASKKAIERWLALSRGGERWDAVREWEEIVGLEIELGVARMNGNVDGHGDGEVADDAGEPGDEWAGMSPASGARKKKGKGRR